MFVEGVRELDENKRKEIYAKFQQITQEQVPFIYLVSKLSFQAVRDRVQNLIYSALGGAFWNLYPSTVSRTPTTLYSVGGEMNRRQDFVVK
ncbi:MAG: hypothetical protein WBB28_18955 [Crinalium sp.]